MPNDGVDMDSWPSSPVIPRVPFIRLSDGPSHVEPPDHYDRLRHCSTCQSRSQAGLCHCTRRPISDRLSLPSRASVTLWEATAPVKLPTMHCPGPREGPRLDIHVYKGGISRMVHSGWRPSFKAYHLSYTCQHEYQCKATVKVHGVFPSDRGNPASSRGVQFH